MSISKKAISKKSKQIKKESDVAPVEPAPIQFFYKKIKDEKDTKKKEREILATQEKHKGLTKKEEKKLIAEELKKKNRDDQIINNKKRERYGAIGPRQNKR